MFFPVLHTGTPQAWFRGSISSCFESHLSLTWISRRTLMEVLDKLIMVSGGELSVQDRQVQ